MGRAIMLRKPFASAFAMCLSVTLAACGGGGGSSPAPSPAPSNRAPSFTSGTTASVAENTAATGYTPAATDPDGDTVTITISGGPDASAFAISGGALVFAPPRNFDLATDSNRDNVYQVTLAASDGRGGTTTLDVAITVTNSKEGVSVRRIATGLTGMVAMASHEFADQLLLGRADGSVAVIAGSSGLPVSIINAPAPLSNGARLLGLARRPGTGIYTGYFRVFRMADNRIVLYPTSGEAILLAEASANAPSASITRNRLDEILVAVGDPTGATAQSDSSGLGKLFRMEANPDPYSGASLLVPFFIKRQVAKGIREPGGMATIAGVTGFTDRGATRADEISEYIGPGVNYGWPFLEAEETVMAGAPSGLNRGIFSMPLGTGARQSGGLVGPVLYSGSIQSLANHIVIADRDGSIWSYSRDAYAQVTQVGPDWLEVRTEDFRPDEGTIDAPVAIAQDAQGTTYILDEDGELFRLEAG